MKFGIREIVFIAMLLAIPVGAWQFVFRPQDARNKEMMGQIEAKQVRLAQLNRATATIGNLKGEIGELEGAIAFFRSKLPSEKEIDKVLKEIWLLAEANDLRTKSIRPQTGNAGKRLAAGGRHSEQPIVVQLEGDFMGLYSFLQALENQPRITRVTQINLSAAGGRGRPAGYVSATFTMSIFFERSRR